MANHTPAPWQWGREDWWGGYSGLYGPDDEAVLIPEHCNDGDDGAAWFEEYPTKEDRLLMQASPDMHEALEAFVEAWDKSLQLEKTDVAVRLAKAALKLAREGRPTDE